MFAEPPSCRVVVSVREGLTGNRRFPVQLPYLMAFNNRTWALAFFLLVHLENTLRLVSFFLLVDTRKQRRLGTLRIV
jgi:hypothetical protein